MNDDKDKWIIFFTGLLIGFIVIAVCVALGLAWYRWRGQTDGVKIVSMSSRAGDKASTQPFKVGLLDSLERVFQQRPVRRNYKQHMKLSAAANEYENFQIVFYDIKEDVAQIKTQVSDLVSAAGDKIDKDNITIRTEKYVETKKPYYKTSYVGYWPDPLVEEESIELKKGMRQPLWVTVYVPAEAQPGNYHGRIEVTDGLNNPAYVLDISLKVWGFTLPVRGNLKTAFDLYEHIFQQWTPRRARESHKEWQSRVKALIELYYEDMLKHRLSPVFNFDVFHEDFSVRINKYLKLGLNSFGIGRYGGTFGNNWPQDNEKLNALIPLYRQYEEILKENRLLGLSYIYTFDEGKIGNPVVSKISAAMHKASPQLKNMVCYHGFWDPDSDPEWGKDIDIWTFQIEEFNEKKIRRLQEEGLEVWTYPSGPGDPQFPNFAIDYPSISYRIIPWLSWKYQIAGILYWCVNWWTVDPYESAANTKWQQNGNGLLYYPDENRPVGSLRLEILRDGLEDYEYLFFLKQKRQQLLEKILDPAPEALLIKSGRLLTIDNSIARSMNDYTRKKRILWERREAVAEAIVEIDRILLNE